jgi:flagellar transcriptional activator FlhC
VEQVSSQGGEVVLDFTRAETMVRFFDSDMLQLSPCSRCGGHFVAHAHDHKNGYVCVLCRPPSRAGKARKPKVAEVRRGGLVAVGPTLDLGAAV